MEKDEIVILETYRDLDDDIQLRCLIRELLDKYELLGDAVEILRDEADILSRNQEVEIPNKTFCTNEECDCRPY